MSNKKLRAVSLAVLLSLTLSLVFPVGVLADDAPPPSPEATEVAAPPEEAPTEEVPAEEGLAADAVVSESSRRTALTEEAAAPEAEIQDTSEDAASDANVAPLLDQLPEGTDVVVLDAQGEVVPLVSQEATAVIASSDPMWCPDGVSPGGSGCTPSFPSLTNPNPTLGLLAYLAQAANQPTVAGTIWIEKTYNSSTAEPVGTTAITIDGNNASYSTWRNQSLTIMGGWDGAGTNTTSGISLFFNDRFRIINWQNNVTVNNIVVDGGSGGASLEIEIDTPLTNAYNVTLENVEIKNNSTDIGAFIDNDESTGSVHGQQ